MHYLLHSPLPRHPVKHTLEGPPITDLLLVDPSSDCALFMVMPTRGSFAGVTSMFAVLQVHRLRCLVQQGQHCWPDLAYPDMYPSSRRSCFQGSFRLGFHRHSLVTWQVWSHRLTHCMSKLLPSIYLPYLLVGSSSSSCHSSRCRCPCAPPAMQECPMELQWSDPQVERW